MSENVRFELKLHPTYYNQGFFNVKVDFTDVFAEDKKTIERLLGKQEIIINGEINRTANTNKTPRIMGRVPLKNYFRHNYRIDDLVLVEVLNPNKIWIQNFN